MVRKLKGRNVQISHGLAESLEQLEDESPAFREAATRFLDGLISHYVLDGGELVVAHAGMKVEYQDGRPRVFRDFCLYGETTGETEEWGLPIRANWAADFVAGRMVVYGHTPVAEPAWLNRTINVDTGLRIRRQADRPPVPGTGARSGSGSPRLLRADETPGRACAEWTFPCAGRGSDGKSPRHRRRAREAHCRDADCAATSRVREENSAAALEVMSRFALDPRWLVYLPPTILRVIPQNCPQCWSIRLRCSPISAITACPAWSAKKTHGLRAIVVLGQDAEVIERRFGITGAGIGTCYHAYGTPVLEDHDLETQFLERVRSAFTNAGLWAELWYRLGGGWMRADALVGQSAGVAPRAICGGWRGSP